MNSNCRHFLWLSIVFLSVLFILSCQKEQEDYNESDLISFDLSDAALADWGVGAFALQRGEVDGFYQDGPLSVSLRVYEMQPTKGVSITTDNLQDFYVYAYTEDDVIFMENQIVQRDGDNWTYSPKKYWPDGTLDFFAYDISKFNRNNIRNIVCSTDKESGEYSFSFYYALPPSDIYQNIDAENQSDFIFAIEPSRSREDGSVTFHFKHLLSSILFEVGDIPDEPVVINYIELANLYGRCNVTIHYDSVHDYLYSWSYIGLPTEVYTQSFQDVDGNGGTDYVKDNQLLTEDPWKTFFMIPQEFQDSTLLNVSMSVSGVDLPLLSIPLAEVHSEGNRGWSPGKQYVYRISYKR
jgi:hypothetical protein